MEQISSVKAGILLAYALIVVSASLSSVSAQGPSPAPAPAPDVGGAFSFEVSGAIVVSSLLISVIALMRH